MKRFLHILDLLVHDLINELYISESYAFWTDYMAMESTKWFHLEVLKKL